MRLFVAIPLPDEVKQSLEALREPIRGVRWQPSGQYHLTLRFIGDVDSETAQQIEAQLKRIQASSFECELIGAGFFPKNKHPRVIWAGVKENPSLMQLQQNVELACQKSGLQPDSRGFKPHITLGKVKGASQSEVQAFVDAHRQYPATSLKVNEFILYSSKLYSDGAVHEPVKRYALE